MIWWYALVYPLAWMIRIDLLLQGGLRGGQLTELVGPSPSGKTQVRNSSFLKLYFQVTEDLCLTKAMKLLYLLSFWVLNMLHMSPLAIIIIIEALLDLFGLALCSFAYPYLRLVLNNLKRCTCYTCMRSGFWIVHLVGPTLRAIDQKPIRKVNHCPSTGVFVYNSEWLVYLWFTLF